MDRQSSNPICPLCTSTWVGGGVHALYANQEKICQHWKKKKRAPHRYAHTHAEAWWAFKNISKTCLNTFFSHRTKQQRWCCITTLVSPEPSPKVPCSCSLFKTRPSVPLWESTSSPRTSRDHCRGPTNAFQSKFISARGRKCDKMYLVEI